jgi:hypothetical protein
MVVNSGYVDMPGGYFPAARAELISEKIPSSSPTVTLSMIALRSIGWGIINCPMLATFGLFWVLKRLLGNTLKGSLTLSVTVGLESVRIALDAPAT